MTVADELFAEAAERILLVDDEPHVLSLGRRQLESLGYKVATAHQGTEALLLLEAGGEATYHLLVTDVMMPGMSGIELVRRVREAGLALPIVLVSGRFDDAAHLRSDELGVRERLSKPWTAVELSEVVARALAG